MPNLNFPWTFAPGDLGDATKVMDNLNEIRNLLNGLLDSVNLAAASVGTSELVDASVTPAKQTAARQVLVTFASPVNVTNNTTTLLPTGSGTVAYNNGDFTVGSDFITVANAGAYIVENRVVWTSNATGLREVWVRNADGSNGRAWDMRQAHTAGQAMGQSTVWVTRLTGGQSLEFPVFQTSGVTLDAANATGAQVSITWLGS